MNRSPDTTPVTLYRTIGSREFERVAAARFGAFPPRGYEYPILYPVLTEEYAVQIASNWQCNEPGGIRYVTRFRVDAAFLARYERYRLGSPVYQAYWIPAQDVDALNAHIVGPIEVIREFGATPSPAIKRVETAPRRASLYRMEEA